ncbi:hypothetical protein [Rhodococcus sp. IEGM1428]|uniref:hypothetical protein n=1 Tax=Rhodococcus sp. IEGM1428 TaxID=3392191 RepID=UPI003D0F2B74
MHTTFIKIRAIEQHYRPTRPTPLKIHADLTVLLGNGASATKRRSILEHTAPVPSEWTSGSRVFSATKNDDADEMV